jgi:hypothetical protein
MSLITLDPRGDLPPPTIQPSSYYYTHNHRRAISYGIPTKKTKKKQCYDWIFSTASNVHIAIDRTVFKTYIAFKSYVLTVADQRQVAVRGIGTVEVKLKREPGSRDNHTITLSPVLHVPDWICNVISDVCFLPAANYEHTWTEFGVNFFVREKESFKPWGYTENFCGLDRFVLSKNHQGRSPMLEDPDREVFSVSLTWPQSQKDRWDDLVADEMKKDADGIEKGLRKKAAAQEGRRLRSESKSNLLENTLGKLDPNIANRKGEEGSHESGGPPRILPRMSSLLFQTVKA